MSKGRTAFYTEREHSSFQDLWENGISKSAYLRDLAYSIPINDVMKIEKLLKENGVIPVDTKVVLELD